MRFGWRGALGILLSGALLYWALYDSVDAVIEGLAGANLPLLALAALLGTLVFPLRARRWRTILEPVAAHLPFGMLWRATAIGMMINNVIPLRAGEVARAYALTRETPRVRFPASFASLAVDRVFDAVVLMLLMVAAIAAPGFPANAEINGRPVSSWAVGFALAALAAVVILYLVVFFPSLLLRIYDGLARRIAPRFAERGRVMLLSFADGLAVLRHPRLFASVFLWTLAHWMVNAFAFWVGFKAVGLDAPYSAALLLQGIIAIGVAAPSAPGFFGVFEWFAWVGLALYGVDKELAVTWAIGYHLASFIPITVLGAFYLSRVRFRLRDLRTVSEPGR
ncbi:MAG TPA: lysylphosphatidylglycerol synthase transmembrane domain-containing protein [Gemmatimonadaceae bacterium]|nr:lysylphosphatidylglycerol synthase transmembrane domain-containing protein [Gemmatimonadaceae bacterium]